MTEHEHESEKDIVPWRLKMMTTQRFANLMEVADVIGDMSSDGTEMLRKLGDPAYANMRKFLRDGRPETFEFLSGLRKDELEELNNAIENARAFRRAGKLVRWGIVTLFGTFVGMTFVWDKLAAWMKVGK